MARVQVHKEAVGEAVRKRIVADARARFFVHGFRRVTMDDLAAELGMSKKTLYAHFPSKTALLQAVIVDKFQEVEANFQRIGAQSLPDFLANLEQLLACVQHNTEEIHPPFIRDVQREAPELFKLVEERRRAMIHRHFNKLFKEGRKAGTVRKDVPADLIIEILLGATQSIVNPEKLMQLHLTPKTAFTAVLRVVLEGALTRSRRPQP